MSRTCVYEDCNTRPSFNTEGESKPLYCHRHKLEDMINVRSITPCIHEDCKTRPSYNNEGESKPLYCAKHKLEDMIDVVNKHCIHQDCNKRPYFNYEGETKPLYCSTHQLEGMIDLIHPTCKTHLCYALVKGKYEGYCLRCFIYMFPEKPVSRNYKTKEFAVVDYINIKFPTLNWIADKIINGGCSKRRPDLILDLFYKIIVIEIDEHQHTDYESSCETKRLMELSKDVAHRPIIFIRFNPDAYKKDGKKITSCWGLDERFICVVKKEKKDEWNQRLNVLEECINYWMSPENTTNKTIEIIELFYDL